MSEMQYWPVFQPCPVRGAFDVIAVFTSESEAQAYAAEVNAEKGGNPHKAVVGNYTLGLLKEHIVSAWMGMYLGSGNELVIRQRLVSSETDGNPRQETSTKELIRQRLFASGYKPAA